MYGADSPCVVGMLEKTSYPQMCNATLQGSGHSASSHQCFFTSEMVRLQAELATRNRRPRGWLYGETLTLVDLSDAAKMAATGANVGRFGTDTRKYLYIKDLCKISGLADRQFRHYERQKLAKKTNWPIPNWEFGIGQFISWYT